METFQYILMGLGFLIGASSTFLVQLIKNGISKGQEYVESTETKEDDALFETILSVLRDALKEEKAVSGAAAQRVEDKVVEVVESK